MIYITTMQSPRYHQISLEEFLFGEENKSICFENNTANTRTYMTEKIPQNLISEERVLNLTRKLREFNDMVEDLRAQRREDLYHTFYVPKRHGGLRRIDAPEPLLMEALRRLKEIFEDDFHALYHTSAFAYMKKRGTLPSIKRHQSNESKWFAKLDLSNFFGSTTPEFVIRQFSMIFPFSEVIRSEEGRTEFEKAIDLAFLNGGLPQGTPISPLITNVMMIPVDYALSNTLRKYNNQNFIYTRYADDFLVSSKYAFDVKEIEGLVVKTLEDFQAPFKINSKKTRYGSSAGSNWNLGVMLNKDNEITVGYKNKRLLQTMLFNYIKDKQSGIDWPVEDVRTLDGKYSYYRMVERESIDQLIEHMNSKYHVDVIKMIRRDEGAHI